MHIINMILGLVLLIFFFSFSYMNSETVRLSYYQWELNNVPLYLIVVGSFIIGACMAWVHEIVERMRLYRIIWKYKKRIKEFESRFEKELSENIQAEALPGIKQETKK